MRNAQTYSILLIFKTIADSLYDKYSNQYFFTIYTKFELGQKEQLRNIIEQIYKQNITLHH